MRSGYLRFLTLSLKYLFLFIILDGQYEEAVNNYESAIHWLAPDDGWKAQVMVAVAALKYLKNEKKEAQAMLLEWFVIN